VSSCHWSKKEIILDSDEPVEEPMMEAIAEPVDIAELFGRGELGAQLEKVADNRGLTGVTGKA
jgi:hypothetical protein